MNSISGQSVIMTRSVYTFFVSLTALVFIFHPLCDELALLSFKLARYLASHPQLSLTRTAYAAALYRALLLHEPAIHRRRHLSSSSPVAGRSAKPIW